MGWVMMSERELNRIEVLSQIEDGRLTIVAAATCLGISTRQMYRLRKTYRTEGAAAIRHKARGQKSNNQIYQGVQDFALTLVKEHYSDFGPTLVAEMLAERHDLKVSRETLRQWMLQAGIWIPKAQRRRFHQPRLRRECFGELIQIDGSDHRWFEDRADPCTLLVFIDDATSRLMQLRFVCSENTFAYLEALELYLEAHGRPVAFYSDKHTVFRISKPNKHSTGMTQFGRALAELNIELLCANSSQAKGRVERANRTLQDRLVKELRLAGISNKDDGNAFLVGFMEKFNIKFAKSAARRDNLHRPMNVATDRLQDILCYRDKRYVGRQLTFSYEHKKIMLEVNDASRNLVGKYVDTYAFPDGRFQIRWKGVSLPFTVFDKNQRVTHAAITESKYLGAVLSYIKDQQDKRSTTPTVKPSSARNGYKKTGKKSPGRRPLVGKEKATQSAEQPSEI
ncbi:MAG: ISNCY family transposase [Sulfitobacter sp.]|nr:MAG: ISNCY family transposase [Sulfitobacter sp.]